LFAPLGRDRDLVKRRTVLGDGDAGLQKNNG
jgi:hypothetical protein